LETSAKTIGSFGSEILSLSDFEKLYKDNNGFLPEQSPNEAIGVSVYDLISMGSQAILDRERASQPLSALQHTGCLLFPR
jgi:hypothetical protein